MVDMYFKLITNKADWTLSRVPAKFKEDVEAKLILEGYDVNGNK